MKMFIPIILIIFTIVFIGTFELAHISVYGWLTPEEELDVYLEKYLDGYKLNDLSGKPDQLYLSGKPYIAKSPQPSIMSKWYLRDYGRISRWSKWSKRIDEKVADLVDELPEKTKPKLSDF